MGKKSKRNRGLNSGFSKSSKNNKESTATATKTKLESLADDSVENRHRIPPALRQDEDDIETKDNLKFQSPYIDECYEDIEEEEIIEGNEWDDEDADGNHDNARVTKGSNGGNSMKIDDDPLQNDVTQSWNPLSHSKQGTVGDSEHLEMDPTAYKMYHALSAEWPALSFDFIRDDYGESRCKFPHVILSVFGTQADRSDKNQLTVMKISDLSKMPVENEDDILGEEIKKEENDEDDDDDDSSEDEDLELDPVLEHYSIKHIGGVNRVRVMPQRPDIVATWSDTGKVHIYNIESILHKFKVSEGKFDSITKDSKIPTKPYFSHSSHNTEGYAMDWSIKQSGQLVTGACNGTIHIWKQRPEGGYEVSPFFENKATASATTTSVEDLQWSPSEATVFAAGECGGFVQIFDIRAPNRAMLTHKVHHDADNNADVNVLSWNKLVSNLLATGGDDGSLSVWDLRHFVNSADDSNRPKPLARFTPHKTPITSVEWHPTDESMLAASDDIGSYIYDLSVEEDDSATSSFQIPDLPPQLLFVHSGSEQFKEIHWHPQITSCLMTTAFSGFSIFIPSNL